MSLRSSPIPHPQAAYMPTKYVGRAHDEESGSHAVRHENYSQSLPLQNPLSANASSIVSSPSRISIFPSQQVPTLDVSGHNAIIQSPWLQRFRRPRDQIDDELPSVEHRSYSVKPAPGLTEHRQPPSGASYHSPRTTEVPESASVPVPSPAIETPVSLKKRPGVFKMKRMVVPPNPVVKRRNEIRDVLKPLSNDPFVLICEGKEQNAVISPIRLTDALDSIDFWTKLSGVSRQCTRRWKRLLGPVRLELVKLKIISQHAQRPSAFRGRFQTVKVAERIEELQQLIKSYKRYVTEPPNPDVSGYYCYHDLETDRVLHGYEVCYWAREDDYTVPPSSCCDLQMHVDRLKELEKLKLARDWHMLLNSPELAAENDVLYDKWIYSSEDILPPAKTAVNRAVDDMKFVGFRIVEWPYTSLSTPSVILLVGSTVVFGLLVIVSQAIYRDWGVAYTAGAFYVALAGVLTTWIAWTSTA